MNYKLSIGCIYTSINDYSKMVRSIVRNENKIKLNQVEFVGIYNSKNSKFVSARKALEWIIKNSHSRYIIIIHQDVEFISENPIFTLLNYFNSLDNAGIIGVAGATEHGSKGFIIDGDSLFGEPFFIPEIVDGVDELLFGFDKIKFGDFAFANSSTWHGYAIEMCMYARSKKMNNYVVPITVHHKSFGKKRGGLYDTLKALEAEYPEVLPFYTTVGVLKKDASLNVRANIKNLLVKKNLRLLFLYLKIERKVLLILIKLIPSLKNSQFVSKRSTFMALSLARRNLIPLLFVHFREKTNDFDSIEPIFIKTNSIDNFTKGIQTHHLFVNSSDSLNNKFQKYKQIMIENYQQISNRELEKILSQYKIKFKSEKIIFGVKYGD